MISLQDLAQLVPVPSSDSHKYSRGTCVLIAGCGAYPGAACLSACASQYAGAGYTRVFTAPQNIALLQGYRPSLVVESFGVFEPHRALKEGARGAFVIGSGFDPSDHSAASLLSSVLSQATSPVLVDGGALSLLAVLRDEPRFASIKANCQLVITPHAGEAMRLAESIEGFSIFDQEEAARALAKCYGATVVLKGENTVVAQGGGRVEVITRGTAVLSKAGTGDVLAGVIGGLLAQGMDPFDAGVLGASIHAEAGLVAQETYGIVSACAEEVLSSLPAAFMRFLNLRDERMQ